MPFSIAPLLMGGGIRMDVIYTIGAKLAGGGIGDTAYHAVKSIYKHGYLKKVYCLDCKEIEIEKKKVGKVRLAYVFSLPMRAINRYISKNFNHYYYTDRFYDLCVSKMLEKCDIFHGWNNHSLRSLRKAKESGAIAVIERASSYPIIQERLLMQESKLFGIERKRNPSIERSCKELEECDYVTIPSDFVKETFIEIGFPEEKLIKIPFGVDVKKFEFEREESDKFIVLFVGQVGLRKGVQYLLKAWKELNLKDSELRVCGKITPEFEMFVKKYKSDNVKFLGFVKDVLEEYKKASVFCFPSIEDGFGLAPLEAMAGHTPVIVSENTGSKDLIRDGKDGFVVPIRDVKALKEKILYFYENPEEIRRMGRNARKHVEKYTWERYGEELVRAYERLIY